MDSTNPRANQPPKTVQYTPKAASIEKNVLALVKPSKRNLALVSSKTARNLNFQIMSTSVPMIPEATPPDQREAAGESPGPAGDVGAGAIEAAPASTWRPSRAIRSAIAACWRLCGGSRVNVSRQPAKAADRLPARSAVWAVSASPM